MSPNAALAYAVLDQIEAHPETWDQRVWWDTNCGTAACFAGWAVRLSGGQMIRQRDEDGWRETIVSEGLSDALIGRPVAWVAVKLLAIEDQLDGYDAEYIELFDTDNTREDLGRLVAEIFGPRPDVDPGSAS